VPQSFVDVDQDAYLKATIAVYELNEVGPLAEVYAWSYRRTVSARYELSRMVGSTEIAAALSSVATRVGDGPGAAKVPHRTRWPSDHGARAGQCRAKASGKFISDVLVELSISMQSTDRGIGDYAGGARGLAGVARQRAPT